MYPKVTLLTIKNYNQYFVALLIVVLSCKISQQLITPDCTGYMTRDNRMEINDCANLSDRRECVGSADAYEGLTKAVTVSGKPCLDWDKFITDAKRRHPHWTNGSLKLPNICSIPNGRYLGPYCYIDLNGTVEHCFRTCSFSHHNCLNFFTNDFNIDVADCVPTDHRCAKSANAYYNVKKSTTKSGKPCRPWEEVDFHWLGGYGHVRETTLKSCRNENGQKLGPSCFPVGSREPEFCFNPCNYSVPDRPVTLPPTTSMPVPPIEKIEVAKNNLLDQESMNKILTTCKDLIDCKAQPLQSKQQKANLLESLSRDMADQNQGNLQSTKFAVEARMTSIFEAKQAIMESEGLENIVTASDDGLWEGDMLLTVEQANDIVAGIGQKSPDPIPEGKRLKRSGTFFEKFPFNKWEMPIPYQIDLTSGFTPDDLLAIYSGIFEIESKTCIRFEEGGSGPHLKFVKNVNPGWCGLSPVGKQEPYNVIYLNVACAELKGVAIHEILHSLGVQHTQNRVDRDDWIEIDWANVDPRNMHYFSKLDNTHYTSYGVPYDYHSVMHYGSNVIGIDENVDTMTAKKEPRPYFTKVMGNRAGGMSSGDAELIRKMYCQSDCNDKQVWCGIWANNEKCEAAAGVFDYMRRNCQKSCNFC